VRKSIPYFSLTPLAQRKVPLGVRVAAGVFCFFAKVHKKFARKKGKSQIIAYIIL
jgi:hypothetical protein